MYGGAIRGNIMTGASRGGGVHIAEGTFTMYNGEINGNTSANGAGGVHISEGTFFIMHDGVINGNTATSGAGGVHVTEGSFMMYDGEISGNIVIRRPDSRRSACTWG